MVSLWSNILSNLGQLSCITNNVALLLAVMKERYSLYIYIFGGGGFFKKLSSKKVSVL